MQVDDDVGAGTRTVVDDVVHDGLVGGSRAALTAEPTVLVHGQADDIGLIGTDRGLDRGEWRTLADIAPFQARDVDTTKTDLASAGGLEMIAGNGQRRRSREKGRRHGKSATQGKEPEPVQ